MKFCDAPWVGFGITKAGDRLIVAACVAGPKLQLPSLLVTRDTVGPACDVKASVKANREVGQA